MPVALDATVSDQRVATLARAILERPRYKNFRPWGPDLLREFLDAWRALMSWLRHLHDLNPTQYWLLLLGLCALSALILAQMLSTLREAMRARPQAPPEELRHDGFDFQREARTLAAQGRHLEAAHRLLLASLRALAEGRHIPLHPEDGNRAVCRQLTASNLPQSLRDPLIALILETEQAWFGGVRDAQEVGPALYRRWGEVSAELSRVTRS